MRLRLRPLLLQLVVTGSPSVALTRSSRPASSPRIAPPSTKGQLNAMLSGAIDPYATLRSIYLQNKKGEVAGDDVPHDLPSFGETPPGIDVPPASQPKK
jgi:hypothetical protein